MQHSFDISIAEKYGIHVAIFLNNLAFWIKKNQANGKHFHEGRYWTYNSISAYTELFPYWTQKQMRLVLDKAQEQGLILTNNFNNTPYNRTQWYALSDEGLILFNMLLPVDKSSFICPKGQMEVSQKANGSELKGNCYRADIKPDIKQLLGAAEKNTKTKAEWKQENEQKHAFSASMNPKDRPNPIKFWEPGNPDYDRVHGTH